MHNRPHIVNTDCSLLLHLECIKSKHKKSPQIGRRELIWQVQEEIKKLFTAPWQGIIRADLLYTIV